MGWDKSYQKEDDDPRTDSIDTRNAKNLTDQDKDTMADEEMNEVFLEKTWVTTNNKNQSGSGSVIISGRYQYRNRENTQNIGFYHNLAHLINATTGVTLATDYTDNDGNFSFPSVSNPGSDEMRVRMYAARFLNGKGYGVCEYENCNDNAATTSANITQFYYRQTSPFQTNDGNQNIGTYTSGYSLSNSLRAMWIKSDIDKAHIHLLNNSTIRGPFTIEWAGDSTHGNHYHRGGNIHLKSDVGDGTNHTVLHELGHNVMNNAGNFPVGSDCPDPHFNNLISGTQCAWTEGWASTFLVLVNNIPTKCSPPSTMNCINFEVDSSYTNCDNWDCGANADMVEGHVVGSIWDLYDNQDDVFDIEVNNIDNIYTILETQTNTSFLSWWTSWVLLGYSDRGVNSLFQNAIQYESLYDIRVNNPSISNANPEVGEEITARVSVRNLGEISSISTFFNFYLSNNSIISSNDTQIGTTLFSGILDPNIVAIKIKQFSPSVSGTFWVGACFQDALGFDSNSSNDCSAGVMINVLPNDVLFKSGFE